ncbi:MAG TPA: sugar phosphate isomerase/epimerase [Anaerolineae bacterium]|nr:sugar phosphate isomerase/epimerase [Anaerolineae bacterium]HIQ04957.1 sugar phosphate isomerase/epimerase [Anaerolineae bacterium]
MAKISLAGWSLHWRFQRTENPLTLLEFPRLAREEFGIAAIELNSPFFLSEDDTYLAQLRAAANAEGVALLNIAVDREGDLAATDHTERQEAIQRHSRWFAIARKLGCNAIRANAGGHGTAVTDEAIERCADSFAALAAIGAQEGVKVLIENHGGISADPDAVVRIMEIVDSPWIGTLPDFGNFNDAIRYEGLAKIAPYAHAVHAKTFDFDEHGEHPHFDVGRCVHIMLDAGYDGYFGIEYEGKGDDHQGVLLTKALLERYLGMEQGLGLGRETSA